VDEFEMGKAMDVIRQKFEEGVRKGDPERMLVWAGTGVGLMKETKPAKVRSVYPRKAWPCKL
jgi:nitronate monooxygenase